MRMNLFVLASLVALSTQAGAATRNFGITGFTRIRVEGPYKVELTTGVAPFAQASGSPSGLDRVAVEVQGTTLIVHPNRSSWGGYPNEDVGPVEVKLGTHELSAAWLNGAGALSIDRVESLIFDLAVQGSGSIAIGNADVDQLKLSIAGTASSSLAGRAGKMTAIVRGISTLDAAGLETKDATIGAEGAATVKAAVSDTATIDASGPATVTLGGGAACTIRASGSATVSGCRSAH